MVFISRISKEVSDETFKSHVINRLGIKDAICTKIESKKYDDASTNYSLYKFGIPDSDISTIISPSSWPPGFLVKEFKKQHSRNTISNIT